MRRVFGVFMFPRVVSELCHWQESAPVVLASFDKLAKVGFYPLIHAFGLSVCARVECYTDVLLDSCGFAHSLSEVTGESGISI